MVCCFACQPVRDKYTSDDLTCKPGQQHGAAEAGNSIEGDRAADTHREAVRMVFSQSRAMLNTHKALGVAAVRAGVWDEMN